jgi:hypothetical protein
MTQQLSFPEPTTVGELKHDFKVFGDEDCAWVACVNCGRPEDDPDTGVICLGSRNAVRIDELKPRDRIKHGEETATIIGYRIPRDGDSSVLCKSDGGDIFELADDVAVDVTSEC